MSDEARQHYIGWAPMPFPYLFLFLLLVAQGCAGVTTRVKTVETPIRRWEQTRKLKELKTEVKSLSGGPSSSVIKGIAMRNRYCQKSVHTEHEVTRYVQNTTHLTWAEYLVAGASIGTAGYFLGSAPNQSDLPGTTDEGEETLSDRNTYYLVGSGLAALGLGLGIHAVVTSVRGIDQESRRPNVVHVERHKPHVCGGAPLAGATVSLAGPLVATNNGTRPAVTKVGTTGEGGEFEIDLRRIRSFRFPVPRAKPTVEVRIDDVPVGKVALGAWATAPFRAAERCDGRECRRLARAMARNNQNQHIRVRRFLDAKLRFSRQKTHKTAQVLAGFYGHTAAGKAAARWMEEIVPKKVQILESGIALAKGDRSWVNDWAESTAHLGTYMGQKYNVFVVGAVRNTDRKSTLPVQINCNLHMSVTTRVRLLLVQSAETKKKDYSDTFKLYLGPGQTRFFVCVFKNRKTGAGISKGALFAAGTKWSFRKPAYTVDLQQAKTISDRTLAQQAALMRQIRQHNNLERRYSPMDLRRQRAARRSGTVAGAVFLSVYDLPKKGARVQVENGSGEQIYDKQVLVGAGSPGRTFMARPNERFVVRVPELGLERSFRASSERTNVVLRVTKKAVDVSYY